MRASGRSLSRCRALLHDLDGECPPQVGGRHADLGRQVVGAVPEVAGDATVRWYDAQSGAERATFDWGVGGITAVAFSPDGNLCAAGGEDGQVAVWDVDA